MAIRYEAYTSEGRKLIGVLPVDTPEAAEERLWRSELIVTSLKVERPVRQEALAHLYRQLPTLFRPRPEELVTFTRELATLLRAGIPIHQALGLVQERVANPLLKGAARQVARDVEEGTSLSVAVSKHPSIFPVLYARLLTVGEETGRLEQALSQIATYIERQSALNRKVVAALRYPAFVAVVGVGAAVVLITFSLPALSKLFGEFGGQLPLAARILVGITNALTQYGRFLAIGLVALAFVLWLYFRTAPGARRRDILVLRIPLVGKVVRLAGMFRFTSGLHTMLTAGLPLVEALQLTARVVGNTSLRSAILRAREDVLEGQPLSQALGHQPIFPALVPQMVAVGEQAGTLNQNLETLSTFYDQETDRTVTGLTAMIEPTMILMVGGAVGFVAVAVLSSLYGVLGRIR